MQVTKNDLSGGLAKVDFKALITVAQIAVGELTEKINRHVNIIRETHRTGDNTALSLNATWLREAACRLEVAAETLATLQEATKDREIEIVNKY